MTRQEQIERYASEFYKPVSDHLGYDMSEYAHDKSTFTHGACWADKHPNWHMCKDELPEPDTKVLCYTSKGNYFVAQRKTYPKHGPDWNQPHADIIAWMKLPLPPKNSDQ